MHFIEPGTMVRRRGSRPMLHLGEINHHNISNLETGCWWSQIQTIRAGDKYAQNQGCFTPMFSLRCYMGAGHGK